MGTSYKKIVYYTSCGCVFTLSSQSDNVISQITARQKVKETTMNEKKKFKAISIFSFFEIFYATAILLFFLYMTISKGFHIQNLHVLAIGLIFMLLGIGLFKKVYWVWILNLVLFSFFILGYSYVFIQTMSLKALLSILIWSICFIVLISIRKQLISFQKAEK